MTRAARNLAWEAYAKGRRTVAGLAVALAVACVIAMWRAAPAQNGVDGIADVFVFAMVLSIVFVFGMFNHTHLDRRSGQTGFPNRLFTYPVSTRLLVAAPMLFGVATTVGVYLAWTEWVLRPLGRMMPVMWPALVLAAAMAWYQAVLWSLAAFRVARLIALCVIGTALVTVALLPTVYPQRGPWSSDISAMIVMGGLTVAAYGTALLAVKRQRHGGGHGAGLRIAIDRLLDAIPSRTKPFGSPLHAQIWIESRRGALLLPAGVLLVMIFVMFTAALLGHVDARLTRITLITIALAPIALASVAGSVTSLPIVTSLDSSLSPFLATRPIACGDMVAAKLAAAAIATTVAWLIVLVLTPLWLSMWCDVSVVTANFGRFSEMFPGPKRWIALVLCAATMWLLTWRMSVVNLYVALSGRPVFFTAYVMIGIGLATSGITMVLGQLDTAVRAGAEGTMFDSFVTLAWILNVALVAKLVVAASSAAKGLMRGWVTARSVLIYGGAWASATLIISLALYLLASRAPAASVAMPWMKLLAALAGLLLLPLARIALAPQMLADNRHR